MLISTPTAQKKENEPMTNRVWLNLAAHSQATLNCPHKISHLVLRKAYGKAFSQSDIFENMDIVFRDSTCPLTFFAYQVRASVGYAASLWSAFLLLIWRSRFLDRCRTTVTALFITKWRSTVCGCDGMSKSKN